MAFKSALLCLLLLGLLSLASEGFLQVTPRAPRARRFGPRAPRADLAPVREAEATGTSPSRVGALLGASWLRVFEEGLQRNKKK